MLYIDSIGLGLIKQIFINKIYLLFCFSIGFVSNHLNWITFASQEIDCSIYVGIVFVASKVSNQINVYLQGNCHIKIDRQQNLQILYLISMSQKQSISYRPIGLSVFFLKTMKITIEQFHYGEGIYQSIQYCYLQYYQHRGATESKVY